MKDTFANILATWWVAAFWWGANYLYQISKWEEFRTIQFIINIFLAGFVWYVVWWIMPEWLSPDIQNSMVAISWFVCFPILDMIERKAPWIVNNLINKVSKWAK